MAVVLLLGMMACGAPTESSPPNSEVVSTAQVVKDTSLFREIAEEEIYFGHTVTLYEFIPNSTVFLRTSDGSFCQMFRYSSSYGKTAPVRVSDIADYLK